MSGYSPLLVFSLGALGVSLDPSKSYTVFFSAYVNNLTSLNSSVFVSLYDGTTAAGPVTLPSRSSPFWAEVLAAPTPLSPDPAQNFPAGAPFMPGAEHAPSPATLLAAPPFFSRSIVSELRLFRVNGTAAHSLLASDPEAALAQQPATTAKRNAVRSPGFPLTPSVASARGALDSLRTNSADLRVVLWTRDGAALGATALAVVVDEATVGCDGIDTVGPPKVKHNKAMRISFG